MEVPSSSKSFFSDLNNNKVMFETEEKEKIQEVLNSILIGALENCVVATENDSVDSGYSGHVQNELEQLKMLHEQAQFSPQHHQMKQFATFESPVKNEEVVQNMEICLPLDEIESTTAKSVVPTVKKAKKKYLLKKGRKMEDTDINLIEIIEVKPNRKRAYKKRQPKDSGDNVPKKMKKCPGTEEDSGSTPESIAKSLLDSMVKTIERREKVDSVLDKLSFLVPSTSTSLSFSTTPDTTPEGTLKKIKKEPSTRKRRVTGVKKSKERDVGQVIPPNIRNLAKDFNQKLTITRIGNPDKQKRATQSFFTVKSNGLHCKEITLNELNFGSLPSRKEVLAHPDGILHFFDDVAMDDGNHFSIA